MEEQEWKVRRGGYFFASMPPSQIGERRGERKNWKICRNLARYCTFRFSSQVEKRGISIFLLGIERGKWYLRTGNDRTFNSLINDNFPPPRQKSIFGQIRLILPIRFAKSIRIFFHSSKNISSWATHSHKMTPVAFMVYTIFYDSIAWTSQKSCCNFLWPICILMSAYAVKVF